MARRLISVSRRSPTGTPPLRLLRPASPFLFALLLPASAPAQETAGGAPVRFAQSDEGAEPPPLLVVESVEPYPEMNARFERSKGWIGADGAHSVSLGAEATLWLFGDTWVGSVREGKRTDATIVHNSVAVLAAGEADARASFSIRRAGNGEAQDLIAPPDGRGWLWMQAGGIFAEQLVLFMTQVEKTADPGVFGFRPIAQWMAIVSEPHGDPLSWDMRRLPLPHTRLSTERHRTYGSALLEQGRYAYIYGTDEVIDAGSRERHLILARAPAQHLENFATWEFLGPVGWQSDPRESIAMVPAMASDCSVTYLAACRRYLLIYTEGGLSERILARTAPRPWGPWSDPATIFRCPEAGWKPTYFCYNAKAHAPLAGAGELVVSYVASSFVFWHVAADARLYWPRFLRVRVRCSEGRGVTFNGVASAASSPHDRIDPRPPAVRPRDR